MVTTFARLAVEGHTIVPGTLETHKLEPLQDENPCLQSVRHLSRWCDIQVEDNDRGVVLHHGAAYDDYRVEDMTNVVVWVDVDEVICVVGNEGDSSSIIADGFTDSVSNNGITGIRAY